MMKIKMKRGNLMRIMMEIKMKRKGNLMKIQQQMIRRMQGLVIRMT